MPCPAKLCRWKDPGPIPGGPPATPPGPRTRPGSGSCPPASADPPATGPVPPPGDRPRGLPGPGEALDRSDSSRSPGKGHDHPCDSPGGYSPTTWNAIAHPIGRSRPEPPSSVADCAGNRDQSGFSDDAGSRERTSSHPPRRPACGPLGLRREGQPGLWWDARGRNRSRDCFDRRVVIRMGRLHQIRAERSTSSPTACGEGDLLRLSDHSKRLAGRPNDS